MSDLPISFSGPMVRALLREIEQPGTGKTQTRRVMKNIKPVGNGTFHIHGAGGGAFGITEDRIPVVGPDYVRIAAGDRLYAREHWRCAPLFDGIPPRDLIHGQPRYFEADGTRSTDLLDQDPVDGRFRQAMHMPKWGSRITLIVTDVRVERLQDCSVRDALAEGIEGNEFEGWRDYSEGPKPYDFVVDPRRSYATLWDSINGPRAWEANPWVVAYTFSPILGNIDQVTA